MMTVTAWRFVACPFTPATICVHVEHFNGNHITHLDHHGFHSVRRNPDYDSYVDDGFVHPESSDHSSDYDNDDDNDNDDDDDYGKAWRFVRWGCSPREFRSRRRGPRPSHALPLFISTCVNCERNTLSS